MAGGGNVVRRRGEAAGIAEYREAMERIARFVDQELGNGRAPAPAPDTTEWRVQRLKTIRSLNELREKLDTVSVGANVGKAVGNGAQIAGAAGNIGGAVMSLAGLHSAQTVMNIATLVQNSGVLIDQVSNVTEWLASAKYLNDIEAVLNADKELSRPLAAWLDFSRDLDANVQQLFGVSLADAKWQNVCKVFYEFSKHATTVKTFGATLTLMRQGRYSLYIGTDVQLERLQKFFELLSGCPQFASRTRLTLSVLSVSTGALKVVRDGIRAFRSLAGISSSAVVPTLRGGLDIPTAGEVSSFCFIQALSLAISLVSMINAVNIIRHGTSKYSDALKDLTRSLTWELRRMDGNND